MREAAERRGLAGLALLAAGLSLWAALRSAQQQDWTYDEGDHLAYARRLIGTGETERRSQLQFNSKTPGTVPNVLALNRLSRFRFLEGPEPQRRKLAARLPTLLWFALLLAAVWAAAWRIAGPSAAHVALVVTALEPNLVANASIVTVDVLFTLTAVLGLGAAYALAERPGPARSLLLGLALGIAFVTKFAAFLLLPLVLLAALLALRARPRPERTRAAGTLALWLGVAAVAAVLVLGAGYGWGGVGAPLSSRDWRGEPMQTLATLMPGLRSPVPIDFLTGVDITTAQERAKEWPVLVLGEVRPPVWYYFPLQWALKTPITLALVQLAGLAILWRVRPRSDPVLFAGLSLLALVAYFLLVFRAQIGYRFALLPVCLACLLAGVGIARLRFRAAIAAAVLVLAAAEQAPYLGNHLAFTNLVVMPKRYAYRYLGDSSIDYRQNEDQAQAWVDAQRGAQLDPVHILPGRNVFGITRLYSPEHDWVRRELEPRTHFRYSHVVFDVDAPTFRAFLQAERRLDSGAADERLCRTPEAGEALPGGDLVLAPPAVPGHVTLACIEAAQPTAVVLRGLEGFAGFGMPEERRKRWSATGPGQAAWFWAEPGTHALLVVAMKGDFHGRIEGDAAVSVRTRPVQLEKGGYLPDMQPSPPPP